MKEFATSTLRLIPKIVQVSMWLWGVNHLIGRLLPAFLTTGFNVNKRFGSCHSPGSNALTRTYPYRSYLLEHPNTLNSSPSSLRKKCMKNARSEKVSWLSKTFWKKSSVKTMQKYSYPIELNFKGRTLNFFLRISI